MKVLVLYADLITWEGQIAAYGESPDKGVLRVSVEHPEPRKWVRFSGWDHYGVSDDPSRVQVGVWKTDDPTDPYYRQGMVWTFGPGSHQERTPYLPLAELPPFSAVRRGQWVTDAVAQSVGLL